MKDIIYSISIWYLGIILEILRPLSLMGMRKAPIAIGISIIFLVIIDLLMTRQLLPYNDTSEGLMFILTMSIGYRIGSIILLEYAHNVNKEIRGKSRFSNIMHWSVIITQFSLFAILLVMLIFGNPGHLFFSHSLCSQFDFRYNNYVHNILQILFML